MADVDGTANSVSERSSALAFLSDVWELKSDKFEENINHGSDTA